MERKATEIHDPLMAHAMVLAGEGKRVAVVGCDVAGVTPDFTLRVRNLVEAGTGIPHQHILLSATHTHSGPPIPAWIGWGKRDEEYLRSLPQKVAQAVIAASRNLQQVEAFLRQRTMKGFIANRA